MVSEERQKARNCLLLRGYDGTAGRRGRVVRQRPAKPRTPVRFWSAPSGYAPTMAQQSLLDETAAPLIPPRPSVKKLREAAAGCKACPLWKTATQTVFGDGLVKSEVMFVGEQ